MDSMLGFKQYIIEMTERSKHFKNAKEAEKLIVSALGTPHKGSTAGEERANRIAKFVQDKIGKVNPQNLEHVGATDVRNQTHARKTRKKKNHDSDSHPVEDFVLHTKHEGEDEESSFIDLKTGSSPSSGSYGPAKIKSVIGSKEKFPSSLDRQKKERREQAKRIHNHLRTHFESGDLESHHETVRRILNIGKDEQGKLNRDEYLLVDNSKGTVLHNKASAFEHLMGKKPIRYSTALSRDGQTVSLHGHFEHPKTGREMKVQLAAIGVKHVGATGRSIVYNIKHQWLNNMRRKLDYVPQAELKH